MNSKFHPLAALLGGLAGIVFAYAAAATVAGTVHTAGSALGADGSIQRIQVAPVVILFQTILILTAILLAPALIAVAYRAKRLIPMAWVAAAVLPALAIALRAFGLSAAGAVAAFVAVGAIEFAILRMRGGSISMLVPQLAVLTLIPPCLAALVFLPGVLNAPFSGAPGIVSASDVDGMMLLAAAILAPLVLVRHAGFRRPVLRKDVTRQAAQSIGERVRGFNRKKAIWVAAGMSAGALPVALRILSGEGIAPHGGLAFGLVMERVAVAGAVAAGVSIMAIAARAMGAFDAGNPIFPADSGNADRTIKGARTTQVQEALDALDGGGTPAPQSAPQIADRSATLRGAHTTNIQDRLDALDAE